MTSIEMKEQRNNIKKGSLARMFNFLRNGTCFSFTWLIIVLVALLLNEKASISCLFLLKTFLFCLISSLLFSVVFSGVFFRRKGFIFKLTIFTACFLPIEIGYFYWIHFFSGQGELTKWLIFVGMVILLYLISLCIDRFVFAKKGAEYTFKLNEYKTKRSLGEDERVINSN